MEWSNDYPEHGKVQEEFRKKCKNAVISNWLSKYRLDPNGSSEEGKWRRLCSHKEQIQKFSYGDKDILALWGLTKEEILHIVGD